VGLSHRQAAHRVAVQVKGRDLLRVGDPDILEKIFRQL
jgi:hypothetical protein